jgi:hypothetical protein
VCEQLRFVGCVLPATKQRKQYKQQQKKNAKQQDALGAHARDDLGPALLVVVAVGGQPRGPFGEVDVFSIDKAARQQDLVGEISNRAARRAAVGERDGGGGDAFGDAVKAGLDAADDLCFYWVLVWAI